MTRTPLCPALALIALAAVTAAPSARAQEPSPPPAPKASPGTAASPAAAAATRTVTLTPERPGTYSYWVVKKGAGQGSIATLNPGDASARVALPEDALAILVLDETSGLTASKSVQKAKDGDAVRVSPAEFTRAHAVRVSVTANGKPVEKASVTLKDAKGGGGSRVLTAGDNGAVTFPDVPLGKATVTATYGAENSETVTQETNIAPAKGGGPVEVTLALSGNVPTLDGAPAASAGGVVPAGGGNAAAPTIVVQQPPAAPQPEPRNDWVSGIVGILILVGGAFFGLRYLKNRGMTVQEAIQSGLKRVGAEMPQDAPGASNGHLKPAAPSLPPLASLNDLPSGGAAAPSVTLAAAGAPAAAAPVSLPGSGPRLIGMAGAVTGEVVSLTAGEVTVGRDAANSLPLPQDTTVSRRHARFAPGASGGWEVVDEGSSNGTYVNGRRTDRQTLQPGDEVQIGSARFRFEV